jgi:hypothetical protein
MAQWESTCLASTRTCVQTLLVWVHTHTHTQFSGRFEKKDAQDTHYLQHGDDFRVYVCQNLLTVSRAWSQLLGRLRQKDGFRPARASRAA